MRKMIKIFTIIAGIFTILGSIACVIILFNILPIIPIHKIALLCWIISTTVLWFRSSLIAKKLKEYNGT